MRNNVYWWNDRVYKSNRLNERSKIKATVCLDLNDVKIHFFFENLASRSFFLDAGMKFPRDLPRNVFLSKKIAP